MSFLNNIPSFLIYLVVFALAIYTIHKLQDHKLKKDRAKRVAANPELDNPLTKEEIASFETWLDEQALPYAGMTSGSDIPKTLLTSKIGGSAAAPKELAWPLGKNGKPLLMLAQINFAELTTPPDFPKEGVMQFYIPNDDLFGLDFDDQLTSEYMVLWYPDADVLTEVLKPPHDFKKDYSPFQKSEIWQNGRTLKPARTGDMRPEWSGWFVGEKVDEIYDRPDGEEIIEKIFDAYDYEPHRIGGHPSFTQADPRFADLYADYDRVLLQIGCDGNIMFGDSGECTFFITQADLKARRFDRLLYNWDCC